MKRSKLLKLSNVEKGMPCKSYIHILNMDIELRKFLSVLNESPNFNYYLATNIVRQHRYKDRKQVTLDFLNFMVTYDTNRINFIFPNKIFTRYMCIQLLNTVYAGIKKYIHIKEEVTNGRLKSLSQDDIIFYTLFQRKWIVNEKLFIDQITQVYKIVNNLINELIKNYQSYIIKYLLKNRRGDKEPLHLKTDVYEIIMTLIDVYDYKRSKIPFHSMLRPYIANHKNKIIQSETWGLENLIYLDSISDKNITIDSREDNSVNNFSRDDGGVEESGIISIRNDIWNEVEHALYFEKKQDDRLRLLELAYQSLPKPFKQITSIIYELVDPLSIEEETKMALKSKMLK